MFKISFLEAAKRLSKTISPTQKSAYPLVKNFTSHSYNIENIAQFYEKMQEAAEKGYCLLKGVLVHELLGEPRAGKTVSTQATNWICIDIDGFKLATVGGAVKQDAFGRTAEKIIGLLPEEFHECSYIAQASSSYGLDTETVSMHLFFLIDRSTCPKALKRYLTNLNFKLPTFHDTLTLTKTGWDVKYTLDRCVADNSRLLYIAPPKFIDIVDPFSNPSERTMLVEKSIVAVDGSSIMETSIEDLTLIKNTKVRELRKAAGLPAGKPKFTNLVVNGNEMSILTNPTPGTLTPSYEARGFKYYNKDGGTSNSYYHAEGEPNIIYNFKSETPFRWADVDKEGYDEYVTMHQKEITAANPVDKFAVVNIQDDLMYKIVYNRDTEDVRCSPSSPTMVGHFYRESGDIMPETIPEWSIGYNPKSNEIISYQERTINTFKTSEVLKQAMEVGHKAPSMDAFYTECPTIYQLLFHILGNGQAEITHFINWLAFLIQKRQKTATCWFISGAQGTGKGLFFNEVLKPLFGSVNTGFHLSTSVEDNFDAWRENKQMIVIDEFELPSGKSGEKQLERLKNWVAEEETSVRAMRQVAKNVRSIEGYIFFSNKHTMVKIETGDRRFNISPRQEMPLRKTQFYDEMTIIETLASELQSFANIMHSIKISEPLARTCLDNEAKRVAALATNTSGENFILAILQQNGVYFQDLLLTETADAGLDMDLQAAISLARSTMKTWFSPILDGKLECKVRATMKEMTDIYRLAGMDASYKTTTVSKMLQRQGITTTSTTYKGKKGRFIAFNIRADGLDREMLRTLCATPILSSVSSISRKSV